MSSPVRARLRPLIDPDHERITWALYEAVGWDPQRRLPPFETFLQHPEMIRYHDGWGRPGDMGVIAEVDGEFAGIAFCRLFTDDDHGHGTSIPRRRNWRWRYPSRPGRLIVGEGFF